MNFWKLRWKYKNLVHVANSLNQLMNMAVTSVMIMAFSNVACVNVIKDGTFFFVET